MAAHTHYTSAPEQEQDLQHLLPHTMPSSKFSSGNSIPSIKLHMAPQEENTHYNQALSHSDFEDLKEAESEDRVPPQQRTTTIRTMGELT
jgi:hypothetical protein